MPERCGGTKPLLYICRCCRRFQVWQNLPYDHCPILLPLAVRAWSAAGLRNTDLGLRVLGLFAGLFLLLAFWFASWTMRNGARVVGTSRGGALLFLSPTTNEHEWTQRHLQIYRWKRVDSNGTA